MSALGNFTLLDRGEESSLRQGWRTPNRLLKVEKNAKKQKEFFFCRFEAGMLLKIKEAIQVDPIMLLKTNKLAHFQDNYMKTNEIARFNPPPPLLIHENKPVN